MSNQFLFCASIFFKKSFTTDHLSLPLDLDFVVVSSKCKGEALKTRNKDKDRAKKIVKTGRKCAKCAPSSIKIVPCRRSKRLENKSMKNYAEMLTTKRPPNPGLIVPPPCGSSLSSPGLKEVNCNNNLSSVFHTNSNGNINSTVIVDIPSPFTMSNPPVPNNPANVFGASSNSIPDFDISMDKCNNSSDNNSSNNGSGSSTSSSSSSNMASSPASSSAAGHQSSTSPKEKEFISTGNLPTYM